MFNDFEFAGHRLSEFGGRILQTPFHDVAQRDFSLITIPGKNGEVLVDNNRYNNVKFKIKIGFLPVLTHSTALELARAIINWLGIFNGYQVYKDTYNQGYYTKAVITNIEDIQRELPTFLTTTIEFSRVPFWYSEQGNKEITLSENQVIYNQEKITAEPIITAYGDNSISQITINNTDIFLVVPVGYDHAIYNAEEKECFAVDCNGNKYYQPITAEPFLQAGKNIITTLSQNKITIKYNWRRL